MDNDVSQDNSIIFNGLTVLFIVLTLLTIIFVVIKMSGPSLDDNKPAVIVPTAFISPTPMPTATSTRTPIATWTPATPEAQISRQTRIYEGPGLDYPVIEIIEDGAIAIILAISDDRLWYQVRLSNFTIGWMSTDKIFSDFGGNPDVLQIAPTFTLAPSQTPTATVTFTPTITNTPGPTDTPSNTPTPSISPTFTPTATPTGPTPTFTSTDSPYPFALRQQPQFAINNFNSAGCAWQGMGGQILDMNGLELQGEYRVHVLGSGFDRYSTRNSQYGLISGWEVPLENQISASTYYVQLETSFGTQISERIQVTFPGDCSRNVAIIYFIQVK